MDRWWKRVIFYLVTAGLVTIVAFHGGVNHEDSRCTPDAADCDLAFAVGMLWAAAALLVVLVAVTVAESVLLARRHHRHP